MTLQDETGFCDVVFKPAVYNEHRATLNNSKFLRVHGKLQKAENAKEQGAFVVSINASQVFALPVANIKVSAFL